MTHEQLPALILGLCLLAMAGINVFALLKLMQLIGAESKEVHDVQAASEKILKGIALLGEKLDQRMEEGGALLDVEQFEAPLQGISVEAIADIDQSLDAANTLLSELDNLQTGDDWNAWRAANDLQIKSLLKMHESQRRRLESLRMELDQARATILSLRAGASAKTISALQGAALNAKNTLIEAELWSLKAERGRMQQQLKLAQAEADSARAQLENVSQFAGEPSPDLSGKCAQLEARVAELESSQTALQGALDRARREQDFIEEAFVRLDTLLTDEMQAASGGSRPA